MENRILLYQSELSVCSYLESQQSSNQIIDPFTRLTPALYGMLLEKGFRRSGEMVYRPNCPTCSQCLSTRIIVDQFTPRRIQKRSWKRVVEQLQVLPGEPVFKQQHYDLYKKYTERRHTDGDMSNASPEEYMGFLNCRWSHTEFVELRLGTRLMAVAVTDRQPDSLSAVYTFFDPELSHLSPGVISVLAQVELAKSRRLPWLYLGYWIKDSGKMSYKSNFRPIQMLKNDRWTLFEHEQK
ncbi:MAG: arginyltransferase [Chromatiales bacterium]|jgi:arginine-tRNA-protein transferase